jgi:hypothetical protein
VGTLLSSPTDQMMSDNAGLMGKYKNLALDIMTPRE